jgi:hypothetical protein
MKIPVEKGMNKPFLADGRHVVEITDIEEGKSEHKGTPFFACRFENEDGFILQRFYLTKPGMSGILDLCQAVGIEVSEGDQIDTKQLLHKRVAIVVEDRSYEDPETGRERTLKQATAYGKAGSRS